MNKNNLTPQQASGNTVNEQTILMNTSDNDSTRLMQDAQPSDAGVGDSAAAKANATGAKNNAKARNLNKANMTAAGIGAAVGAGLGAGITSFAGGVGKTTTVANVEPKDVEAAPADQAPEVTEVEPQAEVQPDDAPVDVTPQGQSVTVNVNVTTPETEPAPLEVHGPSPAQAAQVLDTVNTAQAAQSVEAQPVAVEAGGMEVMNMGDNLTFAEAFATARAEMGPGAAFVWHGQVYGTYYQNEWASMTHAQQADFQAQALNAGHDYLHDGYSAPAQHQMAAADYDGEKATGVDADFVDPGTSDGDEEVRVLGMTTVEGSDGEQYEATVLNISHEQVMFIDTDHDMVYDTALYDADGNGMISPDEVYDVEGLGLTTDDVAHALEMQTYEDDATSQIPAADGSEFGTDFDPHADIDSYM